MKWNADFPNGIGHTSLVCMQKCAEYNAAKMGSLSDAKKVVQLCLKDEVTNALRKRFSHCLVIPVAGRNMLPLAYAEAIGMPICANVVSTEDLKRKQMTAVERLMHHPQFIGKIKRGEEYLIVDDVVTQGGTVAALREYILARGGEVRAVTALAYVKGGQVIAPQPAQIRGIEKFNCLALQMLLRKFDVAHKIEQMTNSQLRYLLSFNSLERMEEKFMEGARRLNNRQKGSA